MKIIAISDTHGKIVPNLPKADLLIHAGDWSNSGKRVDTEEFLSWLENERSKFDKIIAVPGNHDRFIQSNTEEAMKMFYEKDIELLIDNGIDYKYHYIYGTPWSKPFHNWAYNIHDNQRKEIMERIPHHTTILVTHAPPIGHLDTINNSVHNVEHHIGCPFIKDAIKEIKPIANICGHIHEGSGITIMDNTLIVNAASMNERYELVNGFKTLYL